MFELFTVGLIVVLAVVGYASYCRNRMLSARREANEAQDQAWAWYDAYDQLLAYTVDLENRNSSLVYSAMIKDGKAIKVGDLDGQPVYTTPLFDQQSLMGEFKQGDIGTNSRDAWDIVKNRRIDKLNGKAKDLTPVIREALDESNMPISWIEYQRKAEPIKVESKVKDNSKAKESDSSKADKGSFEAKDSKGDSPVAIKVTAVLPKIEAELKRKLTAEELELLVSKMPRYIEKNHPDENIVKFFCDGLKSK